MTTSTAFHEPDTPTDTDTPTFCPWPDCYSSAFEFLGTLGTLDYWRCKYCGLDFATNA